MICFTELLMTAALHSTTECDDNCRDESPDPIMLSLISADFHAAVAPRVVMQPQGLHVKHLSVVRKSMPIRFATRCTPLVQQKARAVKSPVFPGFEYTNEDEVRAASQAAAAYVADIAALCPHLITLDLTFLPIASPELDAVLRNIGRTLSKDLQNLHLGHSLQSVSRAALKNLKESALFLRRLTIQNCAHESLTGDDCAGYNDCLPRSLTALSCSGMKSDLAFVSAAGNISNRLSRLKYLDLHNCMFVQEDFDRMAEAPALLHFGMLRGCAFGPGLDPFSALSALALRMQPGLRSLDLSGASGVDDRAIAAIGLCSNLQRLCLRRTSCFTGSGFQAWGASDAEIAVWRKSFVKAQPQQQQRQSAGQIDNNDNNDNNSNPIPPLLHLDVSDCAGLQPEYLELIARKISSRGTLLQLHLGCRDGTRGGKLDALSIATMVRTMRISGRCVLRELHVYEAMEQDACGIDPIASVMKHLVCYGEGDGIDEASFNNSGLKLLTLNYAAILSVEKEKARQWFARKSSLVEVRGAVLGGQWVLTRANPDCAFRRVDDEESRLNTEYKRRDGAEETELWTLGEQRRVALPR